MSLLTKKPLAALLADAEATPLRRVLGPVHLTMLGVGAIIGSGIFVLTGVVAAQNAGPALVLSMTFAGIACAFAGLCYAEFASMIPVAGSAYTYAYATLGEIFAWIIGWDLILEYSLSASTDAVGWSGLVVSLLNDFGVALPPQLTAATGTTVALGDGSTVTALFNLPAVLIVVAVSALLVVGIRESAGANAAIVIVKVLVLLLFIGFGAAYVRPENWRPFIPENTGTFGEYGWSGILRGAGIIFFAYIGFDAVSTAAQEAKNPQRDLPVGILASLAVCTLLFIATALVLTGVVPYTQLNVAAPVALAVDQTGLGWLRPLIKLGAIAGLSSVILVLLMAQPRIFMAMSRDGLLPPLFSRIHARFRTPAVTTILTGTVVAIAAGLLPISVLSQLVAMGTLLAFAIVCGAVLVLRRTAPDLPRPFRTPGSPWVPLAGVAACLYLMVGLPLSTWERLVIWLVIGMVIYFAYSRARAARVRKCAKGAKGAGGAKGCLL
jgi:APA family basic amino acid/polyamine antiporter